jgi:hypothetical protein
VTVYAQPGDKYTAEVLVRCPYTSGTCPVNIGYWGLWPNLEGRFWGSDFQIPASGSPGYEWYLCRINGFNGAGDFAFGHQTVRWEIYNQHPSRLIDKDFATLSLRNERESGASDPAPLASIEPKCTQHAVDVG